MMTSPHMSSQPTEIQLGEGYQVLEGEPFVYCRAIEPLLAMAREENWSPNAFVSDSSLTVEYLEHPRNRLRWTDFAEFCRRFEERLGGPSGLDLVGEHLAAPRSFRNAWTFARLTTSPRWIYRGINRWIGPAMFPCVESTFHEIDARTIVVTLTTPPDSVASPQFFRFTASMFRRVPSLILGVNEAFVELDIEGRRGTFTIVPPPSLTLWARIRRVFRTLIAGEWVVGELGDQHNRLLEAHHELRRVHHELELKTRRLAVSEERYALATQGANDGLWDLDLRSGQMHYSERWYEIAGPGGADEAPTLELWFERCHPDDRSGLREALDRHLQGDSDHFEHQHRVVRPDDEVVWVLARGLAVRDEDGTPTRMAGSLTDVTKRIETTRALIESEKSFRMLIDRSPDGVLVFRPGRILYANSAFLEFLEYEEPNELIGKDVTSLTRDPRALVPGDESILFPTQPTREIDFCRRDGSFVPGEVSTLSVRFDGEAAYVAITRDITERRELLARVMEMDRMIAVGTLAAGVAHEINNPMAYIQSNVDYARRTLEQLRARLEADEANRELAPLASQLAEALSDAIDGGNRVQEIVRDLKTFSRSDENEIIEEVDLHEAIESAIKIGWHEMRDRARIATDFGEVCRVRGNASRLGQVLLNVLVNAAQAIEPGNPDDNLIEIRTRPGENTVVVEIEDTGEGIAPENLDRIFDPFFTTKPVGKGTGLGLSICRNIVSRLGGSLEIDSVVGRGTLCRIELPRAEEPADFADKALGDLSAESSNVIETLEGARLMIIDDDPKIGKMMTRILKGYEVVLAHSGQDALARLERGELFDLIICDAAMPDINGYRVLETIAENWPRHLPRFVLMTGGLLDHQALDRLELSELPAVLQKPFGLSELRRFVRKQIRRSR